MPPRIPHFSRRTLLAGATALLAPMPRASAQSRDALQDWLAAATIPIRSVDARDSDYRDLEPLIRTIGDARIVQLGEPNHGAGTAFAAKARLIRFLHERLGFDVVAWESGFFDVTQTEAALHASSDAGAAARRGILRIWSDSAECRPLFDYAQASHATARPLAMAGFDMQFTGPGGFDDFPPTLRAFVGAVRAGPLRAEGLRAAETLLDAFATLSAYTKARAALAGELARAGRTGAAMNDAVAAWERETGAALRPHHAALDRLQAAAARLRTLIDRHAAAFRAIEGEARRTFFLRMLANLEGYGAMLHESYSTDYPPGTEFSPMRDNHRDKLMAENVRWLVEHGYPGRKIIIWAHNAHVMNAWYLAPEFRRISLAPAATAMQPMGVWLKQWFGDRVCTIGCTAYSGRDGWVGTAGTAFATAIPGGLEERLHRLGHDYALLDLRPARHGPHHPLAQLRTMRVPKYDDVEVADPTQPFDAILYIDRMQPATLAT